MGKSLFGLSFIFILWPTTLCHSQSDIPSTDPRCYMGVWSDCAQCQKTCGEPRGLKPCPKDCIAGCVCHEGFVRNATGSCILESQCIPTSMTCPGIHEVLDRCGVHGCLNTCESPTLISYCDPVPGCGFGCRCQEGYMRNPQGICTWAEDCVKCSDVHAKWNNFNHTNCQNSCSKPDHSTYCVPEYQNAGCICIDGYLRVDDFEDCQPAENCAFCDDANAYYSLTQATGCQNTCSNPTLSQVCRPGGPKAGCICKTGLVKNAKGLCVPYEQCNTSICGINEELKKCPNSCPPETCSAIGRMYKCPAQPPKDCKPECRCKLNHRRDARGICIPIQNCPPVQCTKIYEVSDHCPSPCLGENCKDIGSKCIEPNGTTIICQPRCRCIEGYYRKIDGHSNNCVPKKDC